MLKALGKLSFRVGRYMICRNEPPWHEEEPCCLDAARTMANGRHGTAQGFSHGKLLSGSIRGKGNTC